MPGLVPGIHVLTLRAKRAWMAGTRPGHDAEIDRAQAGGSAARKHQAYANAPIRFLSAASE